MAWNLRAVPEQEATQGMADREKKKRKIRVLLALHATVPVKTSGWLEGGVRNVTRLH